MSRLIINNFNEFAQHIGQELGVSDYLTITQEQIDAVYNGEKVPTMGEGESSAPVAKTEG